MLSFEALWENMLSICSQQTLNFSDYYIDHEIKKLSLSKLKIPQVRQKVEQFAHRYNSDSHHNSKTWMQNQYRIFLWTLLHHSQNVLRAPLQFNFDDWNLLSKMFCKPPIICNYFYLCSRKGRSNAWTTEQDNFLLEVMKIPQYQSRWTDIGMLLFVRTQRDCFRKPKTIRERWLNHLNPELVKDQWSLAEDLQICKMVLQHGKRWSRISKKLSNRSEHAVKNRFNSLLHKRVRKSRFESKKKEEQKVIKRYIGKIEGLLEKDRTKVEEKMKVSEREQQASEKKETGETVTPFNYGAGSFNCYIFQPLMLISSPLHQ